MFDIYTEKTRKILKKVLTIKINYDILIEYLWVEKTTNIYKCLGGEIGRRTGLKILWEFIPCRFKSGPRHHKSYYAGVAQLVERQPSKLNVASSTLVSRSKIWAISSVGRALDF